MPWSFDKASCDAACNAMRLRHKLIPYIYSATRLTYTSSVPLVKPMYYTNPKDEAAFSAPAQYWFGSELVVAPITSPPDPGTGLSRQIVWLPPLPSSTSAPWRHFFTGEAYKGNRWHVLYGDLDHMPIFGKPGGIVPMTCTPSATASGADFNSIDNPASIDLTVIAGDSGLFNLFEDEECDEQRSFVSRIVADWNTDGRSMHIAIRPPTRVTAATSSPASMSDNAANSDANPASIEDLAGVFPNVRTWTVRVVGVCKAAVASAMVGGSVVSITPRYCKDSESMTLTVSNVPITAFIAVNVFMPATAPADAQLLFARNRIEEKCMTLLDTFKVGVEKKWNLLNLLPTLLKDSSELSRMNSTETVADPTGTTFTITPPMQQALVETLDGCGIGRSFLSCPSAPAVVWAGRVPIDVELFTIDGETTFMEKSALAAGDARIFNVRVGREKHHVAVQLANTVRVEMVLRDPDDELGWPSPIVTSIDSDSDAER
jgi:hypothetical protein